MCDSWLYFCLECHAVTPKPCILAALVFAWDVTYTHAIGGLVFAWRRAGSNNIGLQGVIVAFRVVDGSLRKGDTVRLMNTKKEYQVDEVGVRSPTPIEVCSSCCCFSWPSL